MRSISLLRTLPTILILSRDVVAWLIAAATNLTHQTLAALTFRKTLRATEGTSMKVLAIDGDRMTPRVE
ncbi:hypothetical protein [Caballeronia sp. 15711]|uniref:hypothetical protein n=1 Tax=Caballeronia sp. 15711 TaxID=3391029 RepID=UPI0039E27A87